MNYELSIVKHLLKKENWKKAEGKFDAKDLPKEIVPLYNILKEFHSNHDQDLSVADLANLLFSHQQKDPEYYNGVLQTLQNLEVSDTTTEVLLKSYRRNRLLKELALVSYEVTEGRAKWEDYEAINKQLQELSAHEEEDSPEFEFVTDDIEELLTTTYRQAGLRWRLQALNRIFGSLRNGDFGFLFARPETGKTTFLADQTTFMASQLADDAGPVIWFNNEEQNEKVKIRCYQAALGATLAQINANPAAAHQAYLKATKGKHWLFNSKGAIDRNTVEKVVMRYKPRLIVVDQIDKIQGFKADREDLLMGSIYQWFRELAKSEGHATMAVCQADGSGEGVKWLTMANVANAKTAKQAEADWILGIGKTNDPGYERLRYLHASKNKLAGDEDTDPSQRHGKAEVLIRADIARYEDIKQ